MYNQLKYSLRQNLNQRLIGIAGVILINLGFGICSALGVYGQGGLIAGITLSSLALCAMFIVNIIADFESVRSLFTAPAGYLNALTPVPGWKILLGRVIPMVILDFISLSIGILGVVSHALLMTGLRPDNSNSDPSGFGWYLTIFLLNYILLLLALVFACAISQSLYFRLRFKGFLAFLTAAAVLYAFNWLDLVLSPFGASGRVMFFTTITLTAGFNPGMIAYIVLTLIKSAALFFTTAYLMERKINL